MKWVIKMFTDEEINNWYLGRPFGTEDAWAETEPPEQMLFLYDDVYIPYLELTAFSA